MKTRAIKELTKQYRLLKDYRENYSSYESLLKMREDRIKGAEDMAINSGLLTMTEVIHLRNHILS